MSLTETSSAKCFGGVQKTFSHDSKELGCKMNFGIYLPPQAEDGKIPLIFWLSGLTCTEQNFITKAGGQRAAAEHGVAIVCPDTSPRGVNIPGEDEEMAFGSGAGFYVDATVDPWKKHYRMYSYVTKELPELILENFPILSDKISIMGHSMGGHGALICALKNPGKYKTVSAFAPLCNPTAVPWGHRAFTGYLIGLGQKIKATAGHTEGVLKLPIPRRSPSESEFSDLARDEMSRLVRFLRDNESPFVVEMMTIAFLINNSLPLTFGYGSTGPRVTDHGNRFVYENIFHFSYDSYIHALNKINASDIRVVVGMVGWPTDGSWGANVATAESFFRYLLPAVAGTRGSPARPNKSIDVYVHALTDENKNPSYFPFSRHWGIYRTNGEPKYKIDLSGQGRDVYPTTARGISRMPPRWCVLDEKAEKYSEDAVWVLMNQACEKIDCTSLVDGGSCGNMTFAKNASYAFNMFFQTNFQDEKACEFEGLGKVVNQNPSEGTCVFAVEVTLDRGAIKTTPTTISSTTRPSYTQQHLLFIFASLILLVI